MTDFDVTNVKTLYTPEIQNFIRTRDWPKGLIMDVYEQDDPLPYLNIIFFRDNWITFSFEDQMKITSIVKEIMAKLWGMGIPTYTGKMEDSVVDRK